MVKEILWEYRKYDTWSYVPLMVVLDVWSIYAGIDYVVHALRVNTTDETQWYMLVGVFWLLLGLTHFWMKTKGVLFDQTATYKITNLGVEFEWGLVQKDREVLPFSEIKKALLVPYQRGRSTIHFYTDFEMRYKGVDRIRHELRNHPCFENIQNGEEAIEIIRRRISNSPAKGQFQIDKTEPNEVDSLISQDQRMRTMIFTSLFVLVYLIFMVDLNMGRGDSRAEVIESIGTYRHSNKIPFITNNNTVLYGHGGRYAVGDSLIVFYTPILNKPYDGYGVSGGPTLCGYFQTASLKYGFFGIVSVYFLLVCLTLALSPVVKDPMIKSFVSEGVVVMLIVVLFILQYS